jgi:hypothetical protein
MKIRDHIAYRFITDDSLTDEIVHHMYPSFDIRNKDESPEFFKALALYDTLLPDDQKAYYITNTVMDKLDMLKVKRKEDGNFDWTVFKSISKRKITLILPDGGLIRIKFSDNFIEFCHLFIAKKYNKDFGEIKWVLFFVSKIDDRPSQNFNDQDVKDVDEFIYKILCFMYLSENEEQLIAAGVRHGTRKSGKIVNDTPFPVTVVTSKWNVTSIRTEGFPVSGHFRLQPYKEGVKMIFIEPFEKKGYVRRALNH